MLPISNKKDHFLSLTMVKSRVGLEQRQESATPTGANDSTVLFIMISVNSPSS
jgi:hypothetical protein